MPSHSESALSDSSLRHCGYETFNSRYVTAVRKTEAMLELVIILQIFVHGSQSIIINQFD